MKVKYLKHAIRGSKVMEIGEVVDISDDLARELEKKGIVKPYTEEEAKADIAKKAASDSKHKQTKE